MKTVKIILISITLLFGGFFCLKNVRQTLAQNRAADPFANWRPTKEIPGVKFVGSQKCVECHLDQKSQHENAMAHAILKPADSHILDEFPTQPFKIGDYTYEIKKQGDQITYTVSGAGEKKSFPVLYSFGVGRAGQVYIFSYNDALYESRVTFYRATKSLDFTVAQPQQPSTTLETAIGREIPETEAQNCFSCHATGAVRDRKLQIDYISEAVSCEACHGPGENHVRAVQANEEAANPQIFNPAKLITLEQTQEYCGACHVGFEQVLSMSSDVNTIRFQPYRLFNSKAHDANDSRLSCTACHDPHGKLETEPKYYDAKCFACHVSSSEEKLTKERAARACPVSKTDCVSCHMPKTDIPEMHYKFTDHWIRVVKAGEKLR